MTTSPDRLSNDAFFTALTTLLTTATTAQKSSIFLTQKSLTLPTADGAPGTLLIRASDGAGKGQKGVKISTEVGAEELDAFFVRYADVCKAGMGALKKRDRKKRRKVKKGDKVEKVVAA